MSKLEKLAVIGKRASLNLALEFFDDNGRVITDFGGDALERIGFSTAEAKRFERMKRSLEVLRRLEPMLTACEAQWAVQHKAFKTARLEMLCDQWQVRGEAMTDALWELHLEAVKAR